VALNYKEDLDLNIGDIAEIIKRISLGYSDYFNKVEFMYICVFVKNNKVHTIDEKCLEPYVPMNKPEYMKEL